MLDGRYSSRSTCFRSEQRRHIRDLFHNCLLPFSRSLVNPFNMSRISSRVDSCFIFLGTEGDVQPKTPRFFEPEKKMEFYTFSRKKSMTGAVLHRERDVICILAFLALV